MSSSNSGWFSKVFGGSSRRKASKSARRNFRFQFGGLDRLETRLAPTGVHAALESSHAHISHEVEKVETHHKHAEKHQSQQEHKDGAHDVKQDGAHDHAQVASKLSLSPSSSVGHKSHDSSSSNDHKHDSVDLKKHAVDHKHDSIDVKKGAVDHMHDSIDLKNDVSSSVGTKIDDSPDANDDSGVDDSADDKDDSGVDDSADDNADDNDDDSHHHS